MELLSGLVPPGVLYVIREQLSDLDALHAEIDWVANKLGGKGAVTAIHLGGGSPTMLTAEDMARLKTRLATCFPCLANRSRTGNERAPSPGVRKWQPLRAWVLDMPWRLGLPGSTT